MLPAREKILIIQGGRVSRQSLREVIGDAGYEVFTSGLGQEAYEAARRRRPDLVLLDASLSDPRCVSLLTELKGSAATSSLRVIVLSGKDLDEHAQGLDLGADDVVSRPWAPAELLARVRVQLRAKHALDELRDKTRIAEEGQEIAHTAFQALAVTEKMTRDAFSLGRMLKIGVGALVVVAAVIGGIFFLYSRRAEEETRRAYAVIAQLERDVLKQEDLLAESGKMREEMMGSETALTEQKRQLEQQSEELRARISAAETREANELRGQLAETRSRLRRIEDENRVAQGIIRSYAPSVCLLHVVVAFRDKDSGQRLRYAATDAQGEPLTDGSGNPIFTLGAYGPEVRVDVFGTGFRVAGGRVLTNRHIIEPWWKSEELQSVTRQGLEGVIAEISAYFPDSRRAFRMEVQKISQDTDLAVVQGDLGELKRPELAIDFGQEAPVSGQPVVSIGYAAGLAGLLARAGETVAKGIVASSGGNTKQVIAELARQALIRPVTTQGHIGDVLGDKIIFDAQTASGGSGGPLFNREGKVIGVTYAVVKGFGGSNFGIPIRYAAPLLAP